MCLNVRAWIPACMFACVSNMCVCACVVCVFERARVVTACLHVCMCVECVFLNTLTRSSYYDIEEREGAAGTGPVNG